MSELNKTPKEEQKTVMSKVDKNRRRFSKAGVATPILMTLASQPVFGGGMQCMSRMMSGNLSAHDHKCDIGWSPGGWCNPVGQIDGNPTLLAWDIALGGMNAYGTLYTDIIPVPPGICLKNNGMPKSNPEKRPSCYVGGVSASAIGDFRPLREVVCDPQTGGNNPRHLAAAYLNAKLSQNTPGFNYVLTVPQVLALVANPSSYPAPFTSLNSFLDSTWEGPDFNEDNL